MDKFDFSFQASIGKSVINALMTLRFIHNLENVWCSLVLMVLERRISLLQLDVCPTVGFLHILCINGEACPGFVRRIHEGQPEHIAPEICKISSHDN